VLGGGGRIISNLCKYGFSIQTLSIVEKEFGPVLVGKLKMLLRLNNCIQNMFNFVHSYKVNPCFSIYELGKNSDKYMV